jgi:hypothetical protein
MEQASLLFSIFLCSTKKVGPPLTLEVQSTTVVRLWYIDGNQFAFAAMSLAVITSLTLALTAGKAIVALTASSADHSNAAPLITIISCNKDLAVTTTAQQHYQTLHCTP